MLTQEENDLVTQTGPGTPGGQMLRGYWQPAALSDELPAGGPPIPLRLLGEDLVLFRDPSTGSGQAARLGLLDLHCSHRGTDLSYGRIEDGGLRCVYHGWLYDVSGNCLQAPAEPAGSRLHEYVRHRAYPCQETGGVIFTYMGSAEPPLLPNYEVLSAPPEKRFMIKYFHECNYLQALEGSHDPTHVRFLHRFLRSEGGTRRRDAHPSEVPNGEEKSYLEPPPEYYGAVRVEENEFGVWGYYGDGTGGPDFIFPGLALTGGGPQAHGDGYQLHWRVPIDDTHHWLYAFSFKRSGPIPEDHRYSRSWKLMTPDYHLIGKQTNRYLQDREEQKTSTFTGMGSVFTLQDAMANETQGPIQDRTRETLGAGDISIAAWRRMLLGAIRSVQEGAEPPGVIRDPKVNAVDPLFLKHNTPPLDGELEAILAETGGKWVASVPT